MHRVCAIINGRRRNGKLTWYLKQMKTMAMKLLRRIGGDWFWGR
jgi:hypothetical protein